MITNFSELQVNVDSKICRLYAQQDMPLAHIKEALFQMLKYIGQIEDIAKSQYDAQQAEKMASKEENKLEELQQA